MRKTMHCAVLLIFAAAAFGQINTSVMDGTVVDPQGALIPHAQVTVTNNSAPPAALNSGAWQAVEPATRFGSRRSVC